VALFGTATAALTARLAMEIMDRRFALLAGLVVALLPSQILWSHSDPPRIDHRRILALQHVWPHPNRALLLGRNG
jgi:hypothetical protein